MMPAAICRGRSRKPKFQGSVSADDGRETRVPGFRSCRCDGHRSERGELFSVYYSKELYCFTPFVGW